MPSIRPNLETGANDKRTTFRPPWVKDGPCPLPMPPSNPWLQQAKQSNSDTKTVSPVVLQTPKEREIKIQREPAVQSSSEKGPPCNKGPKVNREPLIKKGQGNQEIPSNKGLQIKGTKDKSKPDEKERVIHIVPESDGPTKPKDAKNIIVKQTEPATENKPDRTVPPAPIPPPMNLPPPPPPPPLPGQGQKPPRPMTQEKAMKLEALRSRPRRRPDWTDMMKEVETGIKLKHVKCNDRSAPVLPMTKAKGQFVYDSEKHNAHNLLLKEIQTGVHLKKVKTNDRSKPILDGLRKFRRQMTIEELITKSASVADVVAVASEPDELDDIDKVRDDLQSTKQMLALELRNKEALERENKRLIARLANLEAELEKEKLERKIMEEKGNVVKTRTAEDDKLINKLKEEASESAKMTKEMEEKYHKTAEELDLTRAKLESAWLKNAQLEIELKSKGNSNTPLMKQPSTKKMSLTSTNKKILSTSERIESDSASETETEDEEIDEANEIKAVTQEEREHRLLTQKLKSLKEKKIATNNEKRTLKSQLLKLHHILKEEKRKYKLLQNEVEKMANIMKDVDDESNEEEEEDEEEEEEIDESESESEESDQEDSEGDLPESANIQDKIKNLNKRVKTYETLLNRAKKGNYLLKANIDRRQDDVNRQKEMSLALQEDLNAVLSELG